MSGPAARPASGWRCGNIAVEVPLDGAPGEQPAVRHSGTQPMRVVLLRDRDSVRVLASPSRTRATRTCSSPLSTPAARRGEGRHHQGLGWPDDRHGRVRRPWPAGRAARMVALVARPAGAVHPARGGGRRRRRRRHGRRERRRTKDGGTRGGRRAGGGERARPDHRPGGAARGQPQRARRLPLPLRLLVRDEGGVRLALRLRLRVRVRLPPAHADVDPREGQGTQGQAPLRVWIEGR